MKHIIIIDKKSEAERFGRAVSDSFSFSAAESLSVFAAFAQPENPAAVLVNADEAGSSCAEVVRFIKQKLGEKIPVALYAQECSIAQQEELCKCNADDVILLPLCPALIVKRINALIGENERKYNSGSDFKFDDLIENCAEKSRLRGAFCVSHSEFASIYKYVIRSLERSDINVQALLLTLNSSNKEECDENAARVLSILSEAVQLSLRRGDISSICSRNQVVILLMGADDDGGHLVANRIVSSFYSECDDENFSLHYDIRELNMNEMSGKNT